MKTDMHSIYKHELEKILDEGHLFGRAAEVEALRRAELIYWDLVDQGRQQAKERAGGWWK